MTTIADSFFAQWVTTELLPFVERGECSQLAYDIADLVRTQLHDLPAPNCGYGGPDEEQPSVPIDIFWTIPERVSVFINQDGSIAIFKYGPLETDPDRIFGYSSVGFSFPMGMHQYAIVKIRELLSSGDMGAPHGTLNNRPQHFYVVRRETYMPESAVLLGVNNTLAYYDLNTVPRNHDDPVKG